MSRQLSAVFLSALTAVTVPACSQSGKPEASGFRYTSEAGRYAITFPTKPTEKETKAQTPVGEITSPQADARIGDNIFSVGYADYPTAPSLEGAQQGAVLNTKGRLISSKSITVGPDKLPGLDSVFEVAGGKGRVRHRVIARGNRMYQLVLVGPGDFVTGREGEDFLNSFEPTK